MISTKTNAFVRLHCNFICRFLASCDAFQTIAFSFRLHKSTISGIVPETCSALWNVLQPICMPVPDCEKWTEMASDFLQLRDFPNCVGSIDGKHVQIQAPKNSGSMFFIYKKTFSIVLLTVVDAPYRFVMVNMGLMATSKVMDPCFRILKKALRRQFAAF